MHVSELFLYPIKSCGGVSVSQVEVSSVGLVHDRHWMLVDSDGVFITQRERPELATFATGLNDGVLTVRAPSDDSILEIDVSERAQGHEEAIKVWSRTATAIEHKRASAWFSARLGADVRLVRWVETSDLTFQDSAQVLVISQASLDELNNRLTHPVPMSRFRPNIVVQGSQAYEEDTWPTLHTGGVTWSANHRCGRCLVTTVDQVTGQRVGPDPLRTLARYRLFGSEVCFGMYFSVASEGRVSVGDVVLAGEDTGGI